MTLIKFPNDHLAVTVPEGFFKREFVQALGGIRVKTTDRVGDSTYSEPLPPGSYTIVALGSEISEEQAAMIVEKQRDGYKEYHSDNMKDVPYTYALDSFRSLLSSLSLEPSQNLIIKENK